MKKVILFIAIMTAFMCAFCFIGCKGDKPDTDVDAGETEKTIYLSQNEITLTKGESQVITVMSENKIDVLSLKWKNTDQKVVNYSVKGTALTLKAISSGEATVTLVISGKAVDTVKVTVVDRPLSVFLPTGKIVLTQGDTATVRAKILEGVQGDGYKWTSESNYVTIESQDAIARITVSEACPDGEYPVTVSYGAETYTFLVIVGK